MYPNLNVKKAIEMFLEKHPWAYDEIIEFWLYYICQLHTE